MSRRIPVSRVLYSGKARYLAGLGVFAGSATATYSSTPTGVAAGLVLLAASMLYFYMYIERYGSRREALSLLYLLTPVVAAGSLLGALLSGPSPAAGFTAAGVSVASLILVLIAGRMQGP
ncbi:hypothetical protein [Desulfurococcus mucosus]|uniref:Uncharacterized protein n=1 Tax=Desulfurococcus mucosus (strain ATCC 35584 / DSM 2162 / JCM 9187 / O7/1) TaxID=765177 RepID=E8RA36_DESM0|nr:hypothetical protein [Desulfurococcus mucosus]ADV65362.1 hypothetical protein Desmu_1060 [Desulfurococcus mucosus DSM 2162]